jgi:hypothetical protein
MPYMGLVLGSLVVYCLTLQLSLIYLNLYAFTLLVPTNNA